MSKYDGIVYFNTGDKELRLVFDWQALIEFEEKIGQNIDFTELSVKSIAQSLEIACRRHSPHTLEEIISLSPAKNKAADALAEAMTYAIYGAEDGAKLIEDAKKHIEDYKKKAML